jgi:hypothetical protein
VRNLSTRAAAHTILIVRILRCTGILPAVFELLAIRASEKVVYFVIPSGARNLSSIELHEKKEGFLAPLGMTKGVAPFFRSL